MEIELYKKIFTFFILAPYLAFDSLFLVKNKGTLTMPFVTGWIVSRLFFALVLIRYVLFNKLSSKDLQLFDPRKTKKEINKIELQLDLEEIVFFRGGVYLYGFFVGPIAFTIFLIGVIFALRGNFDQLHSGF